MSVGGSKLTDKQIETKFGTDDAQTYFLAERAAVDFVEQLITEYQIDVDRHSNGYTFAAHNQKSIASVKAYGEQYGQRYGLSHQFLDKQDMISAGMGSEEFHGAVNLPIGFALNPAKFMSGLLMKAKSMGVRIFSNSPVEKISADNGFALHTGHGQVKAKKTIDSDQRLFK